MKTSPAVSRRLCAAICGLCLALSPAVAVGASGGDGAGNAGDSAGAGNAVDPADPSLLGRDPRGTANRARSLLASGRRSYDAKRFGEALASFEEAIEARRSGYGTALARMDALLAEKDAAKAKDSLSALILRMSRRDLIDADIGRIDAASGGSLRAKAGLLRERRLSSDFADFLDSLILVLDLRPEKAFGDSIAALRSQAQDLASYPEAQYWIGRVYLAEGELRLAELQFQRAYAERASLEIPDDRFTFLYDLASLYKTASNWIGFETCLLEIVAEDPLFGDDKSFLRSAMERTLTGSGYDLFFALYREDDGPWTAAERELGEFYLESGRPQALIHLAAASGGCLRTAAGRIAKLNPSWEYASLAELLDRVQADRELPAFAQDASLWQNLYELGLALDAAGNRAGARDIWKALAGRKIGPWAANANRALGLTGPKR